MTQWKQTKGPSNDITITLQKTTNPTKTEENRKLRTPLKRKKTENYEPH
jgi:hypothetical protein